MPIKADLDRLHGLMRTRVINPLAFEQVRHHLKTLRDTRAFRFRELVDAREVSGENISMHQLKSAVRAARNTLGHTPAADRAVVVEGDRALRSARAVASLVAGWVRLGVFEDEDDAERWLEERGEWALPPGAEWRRD
jgi:hypothetical protein